MIIKEIDSSESISEVDQLIYDKFNETYDPMNRAVDPAHKSDYSCVMYDGYGLNLLAFVIGLTIGFIVGGTIMLLILWM